MTDTFRTKLASLINHESMENGSNTPDFILASYMTDCLKAFDAALKKREAWFGRPIEGISVPAPDARPDPSSPA